MDYLKYAIFLLLLPLFSCATTHKIAEAPKDPADTNYHYYYSAACNCIINKDNPNGFTELGIATYETDPDLHMMHGYYVNIAQRKVDSFAMERQSPFIYKCSPCVTLEQHKKYIYFLEGKPSMGSVRMLISKDEKGKIQVDK